MFILSLWLPDAHSKAPTEVSAILSGLIVKLHVYLAIRFLQYDSFQWLENIYVVLGLVSAIVGVVFAVRSNNIKRVLAYSTMSQVGFMYAVPNLYGAEYAFNHAIFKSLLFLIIGNIYEKTGIMDYKKLKGKVTLVDYLPLLIASLAIIGFPLTDGYVSKHELFIHCSTPSFIILSIASVGTTIIFSKFIFLRSSNKFGKFLFNQNAAYYLLISLIFYIGIRFFTFSDIEVTFIIIASGMFIYHFIKNKVSPINNKLELLDNSLIIYICFIAFLITYLGFITL